MRDIEELYQAIYNQINLVLPEFNFKQKGDNKLISGIKINGDKPKTPNNEKTVIKATTPGLLYEGGEPAKNVITYYEERHNLERKEAIKQLCNIVGVDYVNYYDNKPANRKYDIYATANEYFKYCLLKSDSPRGKQVLDYLTNKRGYSFELVETMGLGLIPSQTQLFEYLKKYYSESEINDNFNLNKKIGETHTLTVPRISAGKVRGFAFRTIDENETPKYLKPTGEQEKILINLPPVPQTNDLILVEGELDSLHANTLGIKNVVCVGTKQISIEQLTDAQKRGYNKITVCFDNEENNENDIIKAIDKINEVGLEPYVCVLPALNETKTDLDLFLLQQGKEAFLNVVKQCSYGGFYKAEILLKELLNPEITDKELSDIYKKALKLSYEFPPQFIEVYKQLLTEYFNELGKYPINPEITNNTLDEIQREKNQLQQSKEIQTAINKTTEYLNKGEVKKGLETLGNALKQAQETGTDYTDYLTPTNWEHERNKANQETEGIKTNYFTTNNDYCLTDPETAEEYRLVLPSKAITIIAGRSGHGKTLFLLNLLLEAVENNPGEVFYYFTYEMPTEQLLTRLLNIYVGRGISEGEIHRNPSKATRTAFKTDNFNHIEERYRDIVKDYTQRLKDLITAGRIVLKYTDKPAEELSGIIRQIHKRKRLGGVFLDYIQMLKSNQQKGNTGIEVMKTVCNVLKELANDTGLPIITGAQFNREINHIANITESAIREADDITHIGSLIIGLWNNKYELKREKPTNDKKQSENDLILEQWNKPNTFYMKVLKNRFGSMGNEWLLDYNDKSQTLKNQGTNEPQTGGFKPLQRNK